MPTANEVGYVGLRYCADAWLGRFDLVCNGNWHGRTQYAIEITLYT